MELFDRAPQGFPGLILPETMQIAPARPRMLPPLSAEFLMYSYKVEMCQNPYNHDWAQCPYGHPKDRARRRSPAQTYVAQPCPDKMQGQECPRGEECPYTHSVAEYWLHPIRFRTQYCKQGKGCTRRLCFFAHSPEELRSPSAPTGAPPPPSDAAAPSIASSASPPPTLSALTAAASSPPASAALTAVPSDNGGSSGVGTPSCKAAVAAAARLACGGSALSAAALAALCRLRQDTATPPAGGMLPSVYGTPAGLHDGAATGGGGGGSLHLASFDKQSALRLRAYLEQQQSLALAAAGPDLPALSSALANMSLLPPTDLPISDTAAGPLGPLALLQRHRGSPRIEPPVSCGAPSAAAAAAASGLFPADTQELLLAAAAAAGGAAVATAANASAGAAAAAAMLGLAMSSAPSVDVSSILPHYQSAAPSARGSAADLLALAGCGALAAPTARQASALGAGGALGSLGLFGAAASDSLGHQMLQAHAGAPPHLARLWNSALPAQSAPQDAARMATATPSMLDLVSLAAGAPALAALRMPC